MPYLPKELDFNTVATAAESDEMAGFCVECGEEHNGDVEPDAVEYPCFVCDELAVYGAQEILMMVVNWKTREFVA